MKVNKLKVVMILLFSVIFSQSTASQKREHYKDLCFCHNITYGSLYAWQDITDTVTFKKPYAGIVHLGMKWKNDEKEHYGTASFIGRNSLLSN